MTPTNPTNTDNTFEEAATAHAKVRATIGALRAEYDTTNDEISTVKGELEMLPTLAVPFDDLKAAILDCITGSGNRHGKNHVRAGICAFATGRHSDSHELKNRGKPLSYGDLEAAMRGEGVYAYTHMLTNGRATTNDQIIFSVAADVVRESIARLMDDITPEQFCYDTIHASKIGTPRAERRQLIESLQSRLAVLTERREKLVAKLAALGYAVNLSLNH